MTREELLQAKPRGEVTLEHEGKNFKGFICYGCQSCWHLDEQDALQESYPHFLSLEEQA